MRQLVKPHVFWVIIGILGCERSGPTSPIPDDPGVLHDASDDRFRPHAMLKSAAEIPEVIEELKAISEAMRTWRLKAIRDSAPARIRLDERTRLLYRELYRQIFESFDDERTRQTVVRADIRLGGAEAYVLCERHVRELVSTFQADDRRAASLQSYTDGRLERLVPQDESPMPEELREMLDSVRAELVRVRESPHAAMALLQQGRWAEYLAIADDKEMSIRARVGLEANFYATALKREDAMAVARRRLDEQLRSGNETGYRMLISAARRDYRRSGREVLQEIADGEELSADVRAEAKVGLAEYRQLEDLYRERGPLEGHTIDGLRHVAGLPDPEGGPPEDQLRRLMREERAARFAGDLATAERKQREWEEELHRPAQMRPQ